MLEQLLCEYNGVVTRVWGWELFVCSAGLGSWELLLVLLEKSIDNCQGCEWVCGAAQVCGCWQKEDFRLWSVVTQQSLNADGGAGSVTLTPIAAAHLPTHILTKVVEPFFFSL